MASPPETEKFNQEADGSEDEVSESDAAHLFPKYDDTRPRPRRLRQVVCWSIVGVLVATVTLVGAGLLWLSFDQPGTVTTTEQNPMSAAKSADGQWASCGEDIETALSRDCQLDIMGIRWMPRLCYDKEMADEVGYASAQSVENIAHDFGVDQFYYFQDKNFTRPLRNYDQIRSFFISEARAHPLERTFIYTHGPWHQSHCIYLFRQASRALARISRGEKDVWTVSVVQDEDHAAHCSKQVGGTYGAYSEGVHEVKALDPWTRITFTYATCTKLS